eukprot:TRINITY_DN7335_c0_g2_i2.p1 TRINITY_DN7335_c0_g2~~TRINITY_DN7335_c0_g2_i2.p1  ORF type:complete len:920 (+),score=216.38 TRINITY_DN7335_c0_g2_i2:46-2805(+)
MALPALPGSVNVGFSNSVGEKLPTIIVGPTTTVANLKYRIAESKWHIPILCQKLYYKNEILEDSLIVASLIPRGSEEVIPIKVGYGQKVLKLHLENPQDAETRIVGVKSLEVLAHADLLLALSYVEARLKKDVNPQVRCAGMQILTRITVQLEAIVRDSALTSGKGSLQALAAKEARKAAASKAPARPAVEAKTKAAPKGQTAKGRWKLAKKAVAPSLTKKLEEDAGQEEEDLNKEEVLRGNMECIRTKAEEQIAALYAESIKDCSDEVRDLAVEGVAQLFQVALQGHEKLGDAIAVHLKDWQSMIRRTAIAALLRLYSGSVKRPSAEVLKGLMQCFKDPDHEVRRSSANTLALIAEIGNKTVINDLVARSQRKDLLKDEDLIICEVLWKIADPGNPKVCNAFREMLSTKDLPEVRKCAAEGLGKVAMIDDKDSVDALSIVLGRWTELIKIADKHNLPKPGQDRAKPKTKPKTGGPSKSVQKGVKTVMAASASRVAELFKKWDTDGSGYIDKDEFAEAVVKMGFQVDRIDIDAIFDSLDADGSGDLSRSELEKMLKRVQKEEKLDKIASAKLVGESFTTARLKKLARGTTADDSEEEGKDEKEEPESRPTTEDRQRESPAEQPQSPADMAANPQTASQEEGDATKKDEQTAKAEGEPESEEPVPPPPPPPRDMFETYPYLTFPVLMEYEDMTQEGDPEVRRAALQALVKVAPQGNRRALAAALLSLKDADHAVREAAIEAVALLKPPNDNAAVIAVAQLLFHQNRDVRMLAIQALLSLALTDESVAHIVAERFKAHSMGDGAQLATASERRALLEALMQIAPPNSDTAADAVLEGIKDDIAQVRKAALELLPLLHRKHIQRTTEAATGRLKDKDAAVRAAAGRVLNILGTEISHWPPQAFRFTPGLDGERLSRPPTRAY